MSIIPFIVIECKKEGNQKPFASHTHLFQAKGIFHQQCELGKNFNGMY